METQQAEAGLVNAQALQEGREQMSIVIVGHVDHGKSTVIGRLLADTNSLPQGKLESIKAYCERNARPFEYAFLLDALKDEQSQGITIDTARIFFKSDRRNYIVLDAPGHIEFLKNMVTGAARAEAALLVIDAKEGIRENSKRHGYLLSMLGIKQVVVLVNKMDLVDYSQEAFERIREEYTEFLGRIQSIPRDFVPVAAREGENIASLSDKMPWYRGATVMEAVDAFEKEPGKADKPFRMPVQDIYKFTALGDDRRIVCGRIESGTISVGDEVVFYPSAKRTRVATIEAFNLPRQERIEATNSAGVTLAEQLYINRGELMVKASEPQPEVSTRLRVNIFWMGRKPMVPGKRYHLKLGTSKVPVQLLKVNYLVDASEEAKNAEEKQQIERHDVADCVLELSKALAFDSITLMEGTGRFVIVDQYEIAGGGIIRESLSDEQGPLRQEVAQREFKFEHSFISPRRRQERVSQRPTMIVITGDEATDRKGVAKALEEELFEKGRQVYYLGMANILYSVDADLRGASSDRSEHLRRLGELAYLMLDAGLILIVSARDLDGGELQALETVVGPHPLLTVCLGGCSIDHNGHILYGEPDGNAPKTVGRVVDWLEKNGSILSF